MASFSILYSGMFFCGFSEGRRGDVTKIIFAEKKIEGKIRRPQLVLIKAEQRPDFDPMVLQGLGKMGDITKAVDMSLLERSPYNGAFRFKENRIRDYTP